MPRPTQEEIDAEIVDRASALFARHGYRHTSVQQIADAVGYSKAGLLHRFPGKEAIHQAAVRSALERSEDLVARLTDVPAGPDRDRVLVETLVDNALRHPGTSAFLYALSDPGSPGEPPPEVRRAGLALADVFGVDPEQPDPGRLVRMIVVAIGIHHAAESAASRGRQHEWRGHIVATALAALGSG
ncbi:TetR/AcrR family transcriptional regulator [Pseudonocardia sp. HH130630-07]|uniref:TetR/AcrR family transcriptional regulator n=1 Tax=Pseudonocardia sp. HH130630-07 TaxID=1690815 RepID=UPI000814E8D2|nr:TetR/AcrR family transcriptional regulator [Pseudonocardia sp. HH130630-07]ANY06352.1 hypothetical protein AFB00_08660 [Pseudonocardia sp. HH130630-07]